MFTGVAPDIESKAVIADDSADNGAGVNADPQFERWQSKGIGSRLHAGDGRLHFQGCQTGVDWMGQAGLRHAPDRHVGVADRLDLLQSMAGDNVVKRAEILVKETE